jgi:hypothetical protein
MLLNTPNKSIVSDKVNKYWNNLGMPLHIPMALCFKMCMVLAQVMTVIVWKILDTLNFCNNDLIAEWGKSGDWGWHKGRITKLSV